METIEATVEASVTIPTATMKGHVLRDMLAGCLMATGKDSTLPTLTGVHVSWGIDDTRITGAATDRYRLIVGAAESGTTGEASFLMPKTAVTELIKLLPKATKYPSVSDHEVTITLISDEYVSFKIVGADSTMNQEYRLLVGSFPRFKTLIPEESAYETSTGVREMAWNPTYMASFDKVPTNGRNQPIKWRFLEHNRPIVGTVVHDFIDWTVLLMPVRLTV